MAKPKDLGALIELTKSTKTLLTHYQSSLAPSKDTSPAPQRCATHLPNSLDVVKATTTLLKSHTTTLSLLLITPPLTPSAVRTKLGDVSSGVLGGMVAAASYIPPTGQRDDVGQIMRTEVKSQVRRLLGTWGDVLTMILKMAERRQGREKTKVNAPSKGEKQEVLSATGVVWDACDTLLKLCSDGVVGLVVKKAQEWRAVLLDAVEELKAWGEDVDEDEDKGETSDGEDDLFGSSNKLGKENTALKELLDKSVMKLKMVGMLYQALIKRRLKTYSAANGTSSTSDPAARLDQLMAHLKEIPETVDDLASAFYDLDEDEATKTLDKCCQEAKSAVDLTKQSWIGTDDEFTTWSGKWVSALEAA